MVIYKTTNLINDKIYVGKDSKNDPMYLGSGLILNNAINKYGKDNFKKEILEECSSLNELAEREIYWIEKLDAVNKSVGYNIALGGLGGDTFTHNPNKEQIRKKRSAGIQRYIKVHGHAPMSPDPEIRRKHAINANAARTAGGYTHSDITKKRIGDGNRGKVVSEEAKKNISIATKKAMAKLDQKELQAKALEGRKRAWKKRDNIRIDKIKQMQAKGMKSKDMITELGISSPTFYRLLKCI